MFRAEKRKEIQRYMLTGPQSLAPSPTATTITINPPLPPQAHIPASAPALPPSLVPAPLLAGSTLPLPPLPPPPPPPLMAVAPAPTPVAVPVPAVPPDVQAMINSRMTQLLDQQVRETVQAGYFPARSVKLLCHRWNHAWHVTHHVVLNSAL